MRSGAAEDLLSGSVPDAATFQAAGDAAAQSVDEYLADHHATAALRRDLVRAMVVRALNDAITDGRS